MCSRASDHTVTAPYPPLSNLGMAPSTLAEGLQPPSSHSPRPLPSPTSGVLCEQVTNTNTNITTQTWGLNWGLLLFGRRGGIETWGRRGTSGRIAVEEGGMEMSTGARNDHSGTIHLAQLGEGESGGNGEMERGFQSRGTRSIASLSKAKAQFILSCSIFGVVGMSYSATGANVSYFPPNPIYFSLTLI